MPESRMMPRGNAGHLFMMIGTKESTNKHASEDSSGETFGTTSGNDACLTKMDTQQPTKDTAIPGPMQIVLYNHTAPKPCLSTTCLHTLPGEVWLRHWSLSSMANRIVPGWEVVDLHTPKERNNPLSQQVQTV